MLPIDPQGPGIFSPYVNDSCNFCRGLLNYSTCQYKLWTLYFSTKRFKCVSYSTVRPHLFDNPLFEYPALSEVDRRSRFYLYVNHYKFEGIIRNAYSDYLLFFEVKFRPRLYNYEIFSHLLFEARLIGADPLAVRSSCEKFTTVTCVLLDKCDNYAWVFFY
jgi:hypothetical protein